VAARAGVAAAATATRTKSPAADSST
jgi:hypothetical protein